MKLKEVLNAVLDENAQTKLIKSYDLVGDIIIIRLPPELYSKRESITEALHAIYPRVRTIAAVPLYAHTDKLQNEGPGSDMGAGVRAWKPRTEKVAASSKLTLSTCSYHPDSPMSGCVLLRRSPPARQ